MKRLAYLAVIGLTLTSSTSAQSLRYSKQKQRTVARKHRKAASPPRRSAGVNEYFTRSRGFTIPFNLRRGVQPTKVQLYYALDNGPWKLFDSKDPRRSSQFRFRTVQDGEFWFATRTVHGKESGLTGSLKPELRVIVDTERPKIKVEAEAKPDGQVRFAWTVTDNREINPKSIIVEVHSQGSTWTAVPLPSNMHVTKKQVSGLKMWYPESTTGVIHTRIRVADRAKNIAAATRRLEVPVSKAATNPEPQVSKVKKSVATVPKKTAQLQQRSVDQSTKPSDWDTKRYVNVDRRLKAGTDHLLDPVYHRRGMRKPPQGKAFPRASAAVNKESGRGGEFKPAATVKSDAQSKENLLSNQKVTTATPKSTNQLVSSNSPVVEPKTESPALPAKTLEQLSPGKAAKPSVAAPVAQKAINSPTGIKLAGTWNVEVPAGDRLQMTKSNRFKLQYDVDSIGPAGVAEVTLYVTSNGGKSWVKWGTDPDLKSPFELSINKEGIYGFRIVIAGRNGLTGDKPRPGDLADLWVGVDFTKPQARLTAARYGKGERAGQLEITWDALDKRFGARPVTLSYGTSAQGPWTPIAAGIPNKGKYYWQIDRSVPKQVYLRLEVKDAAGNVAVHQHSDPLRIDGVVPKARIRGVVK